MPTWKAGSSADEKPKEFLVDGAWNVEGKPADDFKEKKKPFADCTLDQFRRARKRVVSELGKMRATCCLALF